MCWAQGTMIQVQHWYGQVYRSAGNVSRLKVKNRSNSCDKALAVSIPIVLKFLSKLCSSSTA